MPRQARIVLPGELHHVTQRGNYRRKVFYEDQDRAVYLKYLNENAQKYGVDIYCFCLMDNHVHFIVKPYCSESLAKVFRITHQKYSLYINNRLNEHGHRWQSRFYSCVVIGSHILAAVRYVEQNPVRAGLVKLPWQYHWSSAKYHIGKKYKVIDLADINEYLTIGSWKEFLLESNATVEIESIRKSTNQGRVCGPINIIQQMEEKLEKNLLPRPWGRPKAK